MAQQTGGGFTVHTAPSGGNTGYGPVPPYTERDPQPARGHRSCRTPQEQLALEENYDQDFLSQNGR